MIDPLSSKFGKGHAARSRFWRKPPDRGLYVTDERTTSGAAGSNGSLRSGQTFRQAAAPESPRTEPPPVLTPEALFQKVFGTDGENLAMQSLHNEGSPLCGRFKVPAHVPLNTYLCVRALDEVAGIRSPALQAAGRDSLARFHAEIRRQGVSLGNEEIEAALTGTLEKLRAYAQEHKLLADTEIPENHI